MISKCFMNSFQNDDVGVIVLLALIVVSAQKISYWKCRWWRNRCGN